MLYIKSFEQFNLVYDSFKTIDAIPFDDQWCIDDGIICQYTENNLPFSTNEGTIIFLKKYDTFKDYLINEGLRKTGFISLEEGINFYKTFYKEDELKNGILCIEFKFD